ncbi:t-SNARE [Umbelopsis sp. PMI_123]|nr:t-SNARE [Umbelopsis sp. PMI_123]
MSVRNRTQEFQAFASRLSSRTNPNSRRAQINIVQYVPKRGNSSTFTLTAKELGRYMQTTELELEKLKSLTNRRTLFDEKPVEISELTYVIKQNITKLNHGISILQDTTKAGPKQSRQVQEHYSEVISSLQNRLANLSVGFKEILEQRTENMKLSKERREQFFQSNENRAPSPAPSPSPGNTYTPPEVSELHRRKTYAPTVPPQEDDTTLSLGIPLLTPQQQQLQADSRYTETRSNALESIENTIQELGGMFQQLVTMVAEQRETVQRIGQNTEDIESHINVAQSELLRYYRNISSNRGLMLKIFATIIFFFTVFTLMS